MDPLIGYFVGLAFFAHWLGRHDQDPQELAVRVANLEVQIAKK